MKRVYFCEGCVQRNKYCKASCSNYILKPRYYKLKDGEELHNQDNLENNKNIGGSNFYE